MQTNFVELIVVQQAVNIKVLEKASYVPESVDFALAAQVELFEFINQIGKWKWWKHNHVLDKNKVLDELADVIAFFLSFAISFENYPLEEMDDVISDYVLALEGFPTEYILKNIASSINNGAPQPMTLIMAEAVVLAQQSVGATWEEIEEAYLMKSETNIKRQEENY